MHTLVRARRSTRGRAAGKTGLFALSALGMLLSTAPARAGEANLVLPPLGPGEYTILHIVFASAIVSLLFGYWLVRKVMAVDEGTQAMKDVAAAIHDGAMAYLARQIKTILAGHRSGDSAVLAAKGVFVHAAELARVTIPATEIMSPWRWYRVGVRVHPAAASCAASSA